MNGKRLIIFVQNKIMQWHEVLWNVVNPEWERLQILPEMEKNEAIFQLET